MRSFPTQALLWFYDLALLPQEKTLSTRDKADPYVVALPPHLTLLHSQAPWHFNPRAGPHLTAHEELAGGCDCKSRNNVMVQGNPVLSEQENHVHAASRPCLLIISRPDPSEGHEDVPYAQSARSSCLLDQLESKWGGQKPLKTLKKGGGSLPKKGLWGFPGHGGERRWHLYSAALMSCSHTGPSGPYRLTSRSLKKAWKPLK